MTLDELANVIQVLKEVGVSGDTEVRQDDGHILLTGQLNQLGSNVEKLLRAAKLKPDIIKRWGFDTDEDEDSE